MSTSLRAALSVLGKSSPFSVSTVTDKVKDDLDRFKDQLYVEQNIEKEFEARALSLSPGSIIFLCGSSGDGKSEILSRFYHRFKNECEFHLDATHSFSPNETAIEALDNLFDRVDQSGRPLILGINVGMLANYAQEGSQKHSRLREVISIFLDSNQDKIDNYHFLDFENYSKFNFSEDQRFSDFAEKLIDNLSRRNISNPFYVAAKANEEKSDDLELVANFNLLSMPSVRNIIITQLFKARLLKDQFITTRAILDLLHHLLTSKGYLFDNLYDSRGNELVQRTCEFDPALLRTKKLDDFILRYELGLPDSELEVFVAQLASLNIYFNRATPAKGDAASLIRLFSLLRDQDISNNYHKKYSGEFSESELTTYAAVWKLHHSYTGTTDDKTKLRQFYKSVLIAAVLRYANRNALELTGNRDEIFLGQFGEFKISSQVDCKVDFDAIQHSNSERGVYFYAYLKVFEEPLKPIAVTLSFFELLLKLNNGYRPNKYDKTAVVLLEEIVESLKHAAKKRDSLKLYDGRVSYQVKMDDDFITFNKGA